MAQEIDIAALFSHGLTTTTTIEIISDPLCHISPMETLNGTDLDLDPSI